MRRASDQGRAQGEVGARATLVAGPTEFDALIRDKTADFVGRGRVFAALDEFLSSKPCGYAIIEGEPGVGKTALLAEYVRRHGGVAYFNERLRGRITAREFAASLRRQCGAGVAADNDIGALFDDAWARLGRASSGASAFVIVDALDEAESPPPGANPLFLPRNLPSGLYLLVSRRHRTAALLTDAPMRVVQLGDLDWGTRDDIELRLNHGFEDTAVRAWAARHGYSRLDFVSAVAAKSLDNFMYVRCVLEDARCGRLPDLDTLPLGLERYYTFHWQRMGMDGPRALVARLRVLYALCVMQVPASRSSIAHLMQLKELEVQAALDDWATYLKIGGAPSAPTYFLYHPSFRDFVWARGQVQAAGKDRESMRSVTKRLATGLRAATGYGRAKALPVESSLAAPLVLEIHVSAAIEGAYPLRWEGEGLGAYTSRFRPPFRRRGLEWLRLALGRSQTHPEGRLPVAWPASAAAFLRHNGLAPGGRLRANLSAHVGRLLYTSLTADRSAAEALAAARARASNRMLVLHWRFAREAQDAAAWPWELMRDDDADLLLGPTPVGCARSLDLRDSLSPIRTIAPLRLLAVSPRVHLPADVRRSDRRRRRRLWEPLERNGLAHVRELDPATPESLVEVLAEFAPHVLHFYGHGAYAFDRGWLAFDEGRRGAAQLFLDAEQLGAVLTGIPLAVVEACSSAAAGRAGWTTGVAGALSQAGVAAVVGMQLPVSIKAASRFHHSFYGDLVRGRSVLEAVDRARRAMRALAPLSWYVPTVTLRARGACDMRLLSGA